LRKRNAKGQIITVIGIHLQSMVFSWHIIRRGGENTIKRYMGYGFLLAFFKQLLNFFSSWRPNEKEMKQQSNNLY